MACSPDGLPCVGSLTEVEKILDCQMRPTGYNDPDSSDRGELKQVFVKQYLVKWKGFSYLHCSWVPEQEFHKAYNSNPRLNMGQDDGKEYLVKYKELSYEETYWESESDITVFQNEIQRFLDINSGSRRDKYVGNERGQKEFKHFDHTPELLTGALHSYQLEGLNFLRYSRFQRTNVILADEMGLGKTIQSIAFLASLFEENLAPFLVVAPLSTLRNWEREFATWAPHMNVVMYAGSSQARHVIKEHEFYFSKASRGDSKQERIKFDVLLTSYEMINIDTAVLKPIKWNCMIVDEGHRLKNKESKLYSSLNQYTSKHRVLLTGTPLQNNLDELFVLMHFLDAGKFGSLEEFQEEFKDINKEEQISRLHKMLAPHLLRRVKNDVLTDLPPKKELILRVDLSSQQKQFYKAILTRNYEILAKKRGAKISNVLMELRKVCLHPYMVESVEQDIHHEDANVAFRQLLEASGKLQLLDKMMVQLRERGHRVLIYSQFHNMLDILEDYVSYKEWLYERIDGKVGGAERQIRIDRFNAENSDRFCFLLSTRAGGLGINLATADTVIIYDSDWNPHADLQAMARAHRLGQKNKVMVYRLINRDTVEEKMLLMTKKKMLLEHLVVEKMKSPNLSQEELDEIIKYGSKELFSEENEEAEKSGKIHYDDAAIKKLLDRDSVDAEEVSVDEEEKNGFLKAFKVANFEYIDENETASLEENQENKSSEDRKTYWQDLLKETYELQQAEEHNSLGTRKRNCKQMMYCEEDDLAGLEVSSDESDEAEPTDGEAARQGNPRRRKPYRKRARDNSEPIPLMEGEGEGSSLIVLGFNKSERKIFRQTFMRYGSGDYDWKEFVPRLKQKTYDEINNYGILFLKHIAEDPKNLSPTFSDGVPKEGLKIDEVLARVAFLMLVKEKCKIFEDHPTKPVFPDHIVKKFKLGNGKFWKDEHDKMLIRAVSKHGYGKWLAIVDDKDLGIEELVCKELGFPFPYISLSGADQAGLPESSLNQEAGTSGTNDDSADGGQKNPVLSYERIHRGVGDHVRRRVTLLEKAMSYEYAEEYYGKMGAEQAETETTVMDHDVEMKDSVQDPTFRSSEWKMDGDVIVLD